uniref:Uncharacterized protein n=1 Tax=Marseillevirus LCMAC101 TaxID=2506602 RepID=A0A481YRD9_9VIRU|nr:MAG: hypothetical protein LCMAC101_04280 [Marseillevirus LCMAC101]
MDSENLFDRAFEKGTIDPTHDGFHVFSKDFKKKFLQLNQEFNDNYFAVYGPGLSNEDYWEHPPISIEVVNGNFKNKRSCLADMKYDDDELVYAIPVKEKNGVYTIPDGKYYFYIVLIIGPLDICCNYSTDFMGMMKRALALSDVEIIATKEWNGEYPLNPRDLSLTVRDKCGHHWKILFG